MFCLELCTCSRKVCPKIADTTVPYGARDLPSRFPDTVWTWLVFLPKISCPSFLFQASTWSWFYLAQQYDSLILILKPACLSHWHFYSNLHFNANQLHKTYRVFNVKLNMIKIDEFRWSVNPNIPHSQKSRFDLQVYFGLFCQEIKN